MTNFDYGIIGNCYSAALVSKYGSIDWCCLPRFDSGSVFAHILDKKIGGRFAIEPGPGFTTTQAYIKNTNILVTHFISDEAEFELIDFMPRYQNSDGTYYCPPDLIRYIKIIKGTPQITVIYKPALNYAAGKTVSEMNREYIKSYSQNGSYESIYLYTDLDKEAIFSSKPINLEHDAFLLLSYHEKLLNQTLDRNYLKLEKTKVYWMMWADGTISLKKYNDAIVRSALVLKLLTFQTSGAIIAAITTSLPETIGEVRNWDYRYCWIRDASMIIRTLIKLGHSNSARRFMNFILDIIPLKDEKIQIMYGIAGEKELKEKILGHLDGYEGSQPVRIGNDAYRQKQNDIYGVLMDVIYESFQLYRINLQNSEEFWTITRTIVRYVKNNWCLPDKGIWELRSFDKNLTFSKLLCWVAIDRAIKIAEMLHKSDYVALWSILRKEIHDEIHARGWNEKIKAFTQVYDNEDMDASILLMEFYGFINASDPKYISTVKAIKEQLCYNGLMYRYKNHDDFGKPTTSFTICTFWLIKALYRIGEKKEAEKMFRQVLSYSNHLGLFSEGIDFDTKQLLGNFPQGYSHLALIETALEMAGDITTDEQILEAIH